MASLAARPCPLPPWMGVTGFVDIHCHLIAGIDDGPKDEQQTGALIDAARSAGIAAIVATMHCSSRYGLDSDDRDARLAAAESMAADRNQPLETGRFDPLKTPSLSQKARSHNNPTGGADMHTMSRLLVADSSQETSPILNGARLEALNKTNLLDSESEIAFDRLTELACNILDTPVALVSLVDQDRQFFKSARGLPEPWASRRETPLTHSFCQHAVVSKRPFVIGDAQKDPVVCDNPAIPDLGVVAYLGIPLIRPGGHAIGSFCVIDSKPREWTRRQIRVMALLADSVMSEIALRSHLRKVEEQSRHIEQQTDELRRVNQELEQFTSAASHDLQEPVRSLVSFSNLLREDLGDDLPAKAAIDLQYISEAALRMQRLTRDLLTLARAGRAGFETTKVQLGACVDEALAALRSSVAESGASIERCGLPEVRGNRTLLTQLYQNLLSNALKFSTTTPRVTLTAEKSDAFWTLGVRDEGIGIKPEYTERIFEPFRRLHGVSQYDGSGIGLAVCRKAVERHGGKIWVESAPGRGSHFRFTLQIEA